MNRFVHTVLSSEAGIRLDRVLAAHFKTQSRAWLQKSIHEGIVLVNGKVVKASHKLQGGDRIELSWSEPGSTAAELQPWDFPLQILYEDEQLLAINKLPGVVVHPGAGRRTHTIANALLSRSPELCNVGHPQRPGIVHRLDRQTSGVLLVAKTTLAYAALVTSFKNRQIEKHYRALAFGTFSRKFGKIDVAIGRDPQNRKKISARSRTSRSAVTLYRVLKQFDFAALLDVQILTGRTHQIRVHLASENHPIVGDTLYGGGNWNRIGNEALRAKLRKAGFFGLHAYSVDLPHPTSGHSLHIEAPLPEVWNLVS